MLTGGLGLSVGERERKWESGRLGLAHEGERGRGRRGEIGPRGRKKKRRGRGKEFHFLFPFSNKFSNSF